MALPKAVLCVLGDYSADMEEAKLRQAGFATAMLRWKELVNQTNDWMQLAEILDDASIQAWVIAGESVEVTDDVISRMTLLALALRRDTQPGTALVLCDEGRPKLPPLMDHVGLFHALDPFAARLMAARFKKGVRLSPPFHIRPLLDPLIGLWLEVAPGINDAQTDFSVGVLDAEITAFGVGPVGVIPAKSQLAYPVLGIKGEVDGKGFSACAAKNSLNETTACFCKVEGIPHGIFLGNYLNEDAANNEVTVLPFFAGK